MKYVIIRGIGIAASVFALNVSPQESERDDPELQYVQPFQVFDNLYFVWDCAVKSLETHYLRPIYCCF